MRRLAGLACVLVATACGPHRAAPASGEPSSPPASTGASARPDPGQVLWIVDNRAGNSLEVGYVAPLHRYVLTLAIDGYGQVTPLVGVHAHRDTHGAWARFSGTAVRLPPKPGPGHLGGDVHMEVRASVTADGSGFADVTVDDHRYHLVSSPAPHDAAHVRDLLLRDLRRSRWSDIYRHGWTRQTGPERAFVRQFAGLHYTIEPTGPIRYDDVPAVATASVPVHVVVHGRGRSVEKDCNLLLEYEHRRWVFFLLEDGLTGVGVSGSGRTPAPVTGG